MMSRLYIILAIIGGFFALGYYCICLRDDNRKLSDDLAQVKAELKTSLKESELKTKAFKERERNLLQDRKELQNEYEKLLELSKTDEHYVSWSDVLLPASVSNLLQ